MRVLIIDDDESILEYLAKFFENLKHEAITCSSSKEGLKKVVVEQPDLVLLDIMLPEKNGLELLKEIKEIDKEVAVAMITAYKDAERVIEAFRLGAIDCLLKPFNTDYIINTVLPRVKLRKR